MLSRRVSKKNPNRKALKIRIKDLQSLFIPLLFFVFYDIILFLNKGAIIFFNCI